MELINTADQIARPDGCRRVLRGPRRPARVPSVPQNAVFATDSRQQPSRHPGSRPDPSVARDEIRFEAGENRALTGRA